MKINEALSEKMSKLEEGNGPNKANKKYKETPSNTKVANGTKKVKNRNKKDNKKDNPKGTSSFQDPNPKMCNAWLRSLQLWCRSEIRAGTQLTPLAMVDPIPDIKNFVVLTHLQNTRFTKYCTNL